MNAATRERDQGAPAPEPLPDAPQLLVPNPNAAAFLRLLGRSTRLRRTDGEYAVRPTVPLLGRWLTHYAERAEVPGSVLLLPMTTALADHWATGQSDLEDANLAALLGWIDPADGLTGQQAARLAEDPVRCPPACPVTDPTFDNEVLEGRMAAIRDATEAGDGPALARAQAAMDAALHSQLAPTWDLMWRAHALLAELPEAAHAQRRWKDDRRSFTAQAAWLREGGAPQPRRDSAVAAAKRLARLEREQQRLAVERAHDDPLVMAEYRLTGEAFAGTVVDADLTRLDAVGKKPKLRPWLIVQTTDAVIVEPGALLTCPDYPSQTAKVIEIADADNHNDNDNDDANDNDTAGTLVTLELSGGMGRALAAPPGSTPAEGDRSPTPRSGTTSSPRRSSRAGRRRRGPTAARRWSTSRPTTTPRSRGHDRGAKSRTAERHTAPRREEAPREHRQRPPSAPARRPTASSPTWRPPSRAWWSTPRPARASRPWWCAPPPNWRATTSE